MEAPIRPLCTMHLDLERGRALPNRAGVEVVFDPVDVRSGIWPEWGRRQLGRVIFNNDISNADFYG